MKQLKSERVIFRASAGDLAHISALGRTMAEAGTPFVTKSEVIRLALANAAASLRPK